MVSTWRFWSGKEINLSRSHPFQILFLLAIVLFVILRFSQGVLFAVRAALYVLGYLGACGVFVVARPAPSSSLARGLTPVTEPDCLHHS